MISEGLRELAVIRVYLRDTLTRKPYEHVSVRAKLRIKGAACVHEPNEQRADSVQANLQARFRCMLERS